MELFFTRLLLINKRLFHTGSYLLLLALIPLTALALRHVSQEEKGILTIAVAREDPAVMNRLSEETRLLRFLREDTPDEAIARVNSGQADCAWIFEENYRSSLSAAAMRQPRTVVRIYTAEDTVFMRLAREKLFAALYPDLSREIFRTFLSEISSSGDTLSGAEPASPSGLFSDAPMPGITASDIPEDDILAYYSAGAVTESLVRFERIDSPDQNTDKAAIEEDYLLLPLRGLLSILIFAAGAASVIFYEIDERNGCFTWLTRAGRSGMLSGYLLSGMFWTALMTLAALAAAGSFTAAGHELLLMMLYIAAVFGMCYFLHLLLRRPEHLATLLPLLILLMLGLCPVFLNAKQLHFLAVLLPAYHYLHGIGSSYALRNLLFLAALYLMADLLAVLFRARLLPLAEERKRSKRA